MTANEDVTLVPVYIVFGVLFFIGIIVIILVTVTYCQKSNNNRCCCKGQSSNQGSDPVVSIAPQRQQNPARNYAVLEDHLHLVDSPELSIETKSRPITAVKSAVRRKVTNGKEYRKISNKKYIQWFNKLKFM